MDRNVFDNATLEAIGELIALGEQHGLGIWFVPDTEGWKIGYMLGTVGGGDLVSGYDLGDTVRAAFRPLEDEGERQARARAEWGQDA
jgi:hypothetical protein